MLEPQLKSWPDIDADTSAGILVRLIPESLPASLIPTREEVEDHLGLQPHRWYMAKPEALIAAVVMLYVKKQGLARGIVRNHG